jgi:flagellar basal-body rod protein FlgC
MTMSLGLFRSIQTSATGLHGQRVKMDVVAQNLANAETTRTEEGLPYRRQRAVFAEILARKLGKLQMLRGRGEKGPGGSVLTRTHPGHLPGGLQLRRTEMPGGLKAGVDVAPDASEFRVVYDPGHPDADSEGYVMLPNVNVITEMVDMITASRAYEANVSAIQSAKDMFTRALDI